MIKFLLTIFLSIATVFVMPSKVMENMRAEIFLIDNPNEQEVTLSVSQSVAHVVGGKDLTLKVYNITGAPVLKVRIDSNDKRIELNLPKGCYLVQVGKVVRKVVIK